MKNVRKVKNMKKNLIYASPANQRLKMMVKKEKNNWGDIYQKKNQKKLTLFPSQELLVDLQ